MGEVGKDELSSMTALPGLKREKLAILGGMPVRERSWPTWPRADAGTEEVVRDVLASGRWAISGPYTGRQCYERRFADAFARFNRINYCVPTTSGTAALTLALLALGVGPGDEVLVPGLTWVACASSVAALGAVPVLTDVDPETLCMSSRAAGAAIGPSTKAILLVHLFCSIADVDQFVQLSKASGVPLIEDCSQAHGAQWRGQSVGTFGDVGCFSMQQSKLLTSGEGGAVITGRHDLYNRIEQFRSDGRRFSDSPEPGRLELEEVGEVLGRNLSLSELLAAILLDRLKHLEGENRKRAANAAVLDALLRDVPGISCLNLDPRATAPAYYNYVLRLDSDTFGGNSVNVIGRAVSAELGMEVSPVYRPLNDHPLYRPQLLPQGNRSHQDLQRLHPARFSLPAAEEAYRTCLTFMHPALLDDEDGMLDIATAFNKVQLLQDQLTAVVPEEYADTSYAEPILSSKRGRTPE